MKNNYTINNNIKTRDNKNFESLPYFNIKKKEINIDDLIISKYNKEHVEKLIKIDFYNNILICIQNTDKQIISIKKI